MHNPDWVNLLGQPELDDQGNVVSDNQGRPRIALGKAGANTIRSLIKYLREKTEIAQVLPAIEDTPSEPQADTVPPEAPSPESEEQAPTLA